MRKFVRAAVSGEHHWAFYVLTIVVILLAFTIGQIPIGVLINNATESGAFSEFDVNEFKSTLNFELLGLPAYVGLLLMLIGPVLAMGVLCFSIVRVHKRPLKSAFTGRPKVDFRRIVFAFTLWLALSMSVDVVLFWAFPDDYMFNTDIIHWLPLLAVSLLILPIQTSFEELFFRGYLLQWIGSVNRSPWIVVLVTSVIFAAVHLGNPEIQKFGIEIMVFYYLSVAVFLAILTLLDNGLELALGIHAATNVYGAAFVSFEGSVLQTNALVELKQLDPVLMVCSFYAMLIVFVIIAFRKYKLNRVSSLLNRFELAETNEISTDI